MLSYVSYNMAPNAGRNEGELLLLNAPTSPAQFEVMIDLSRVTKDVTKIKRVLLYADGPTAQWMLNVALIIKRQISTTSERCF